MALSVQFPIWEDAMPRPLLVSAINKLAIVGQQAGFSVEQMIQLLDEGVTVETLLELIAWSLERRQPARASLPCTSNWVMYRESSDRLSLFGPMSQIFLSKSLQNTTNAIDWNRRSPLHSRNRRLEGLNCVPVVGLSPEPREAATPTGQGSKKSQNNNDHGPIPLGRRSAEAAVPI